MAGHVRFLQNGFFFFFPTKSYSNLWPLLHTVDFSINNKLTTPKKNNEKKKGTLSELFFNAEQPACNHYKFTIGLIKFFFWIGLILGASPRSTGKKNYI